MDCSKRFPATQIIDGEHCPPYYDPTHYRRAMEFAPERGHIIEVSYPRSGTHLMQQLIQLIVNGGRSAETYAKFREGTPTLELNEPPARVASPRLLRTHLPMNRIRFSEDARYVYVARNPCDVCVSSFMLLREFPVFQFKDGKFDDFLDVFFRGQFGFGDYFDHVLSGYAHKTFPNVFFVTYEEILKNKADTIFNLANFLGGDYGAMMRDNKFVFEQVMEKSEFSFMKRFIPSALEGVLKAYPEEWRRLNATPNVKVESACDATPMANIVRTGGVGGWKSYFLIEGFEKMRVMINKKFGGTNIMNLWQSD